MIKPDFPDEGTDYPLLAQQARALRQDEPDLLANAANFAALIYHGVADLNWAGWYFVRGDFLVVGPFQGRPACTRIARGKGVCGLAWGSGKTQRVDDVLEFPGHIPCDSASRSELVIPVFHDGQVCALLDIDSPAPARFSLADARGLEGMVHEFAAAAAWSSLLDLQA